MNTNSIFKKGVNLLTLASFLLWNLSVAVPEGGQVAAGNAAITQSGSTTTVNQTSQNAVINWQGFDTASHEAVNFVQPNSSSIALNRINSGVPTNFQGSLSANGQVWILNPSGVLFGAGSKVDVAGLLVTTHNITDANFMSGNYQFALDPNSLNSKIINNGLISAKDSGIVALVAPWVENNGIITAHLGKVSLSSGTAFVLDMYGDSLINFGSNAPLQNSYISNSGVIKADGGKVHMTANSAAGILDNVISMSGTIQAKSVGMNKKGEIILYSSNAQTKKLSGVTKVTGKLDASDGGFIETSGEHVELNGAEINAGAGGSWLLDPTDILVDATLAATIAGQLDSHTSVTLDTSGAGPDFGDITVSSPIVMTNPAVFAGNTILTFIATRDVHIDADISLNPGNAINTGAAFIVTAGNKIFVNTPNISAGAVGNPVIITGFVFNSPVVLQQNVTMSSRGSSTFNSTIDGFAVGVGNLILSVPLNTLRLSQSIGSNAALASLTITTAAFGVNLGTGPGAYLIKTEGSQVYNQRILAGTNSNATSFTFTTNLALNPLSSVTINGGMNLGNQNVGVTPVTINSNAVFRGTIFNPAFGIPQLTVQGTTLMDGTTVTTTGSQNYQDAVTVSNSGANLTGGGTIEFGSTLNSAPANSGALTTNAPNTQFDGVVNGIDPLSSLTITGSTITLNGGTIIQATQNYGQIFVITALGGTLNASNSVTFTNTSDLRGPGALVINGVGVFDAPVGNITPLASLFMSGTTNINTTLIETVGAQTYNGVVFVGNASNPSLLNFWSTSTADITFNDSLVNGGPSLTNPVDITITGNLVLAPPNGNLVTIFGGLQLNSLHVTGTTSLNSGVGITTMLNQTYDGPVTLNQNGSFLTLNAGGVITFNSTLQSGAIPRTATIGLNDATSVLNFNGIVGGSGGTNPLAQLLFSGDPSAQININTSQINTTGIQFYSSHVRVGADTTLTSTAAGVTFLSLVDGDGSGPWDLTVSSLLATTVVDSIGSINPLDVLTITAPAIDINPLLNITLDISTQGTQIYNGPVRLDGPQVTLNSTGGSITFNGTVDSNGTPSSLTLNAFSAVTLTGNIGTGVGGILSTLHVINQANINTAAIHTVDSQLYDGPVTLLSSTKLTVDNGITGQIIFGGTVTGPFGLAIDPPAIVQFNADVNTASLNVQATQEIQINAANIQTTGGQVYDAPAVILQFNPGSTLTSTGGSITFNGTVDSDGFGPWDLTLSAPTGQVIFNAVVGGNDPLNNLAVTATSTLIFFDINTVLNQSYTGHVGFLNDLQLSSSGGDITFNGTVGSTFEPTINAAGLVSFNGNVTGLRGLVVNAGQIDINAPTTFIEASYREIFNAPVINLNVPVLEFNVLGVYVGVVFTGTVDGSVAATFTLNPSNAVHFGDNVGFTTPLQSVTVNGGGTVFNSGSPQSLTTVADQNYNGFVKVQSSTSLISGGDITFASILDGPGDLTINATTGSGNVNFQDVVGLGFLSALNALTVTANAINIDTTQLLTTNNQTYTGPMALTQDTIFTSNSGSGTITFNSTISNSVTSQGLTIDSTSSGFVVFNDVIGTAGIPYAFLTITGNTTFASTIGSIVYVSGAEIYNNDLTFNNISTLALNGTSVTFGGAVTSSGIATDVTIPGSLILTNSGSIGQTVGGEINSLTVTGQTVINNSPRIETMASQDYQGLFTLNGTAYLTVKNNTGTITFESTVEGPGSLGINDFSFLYLAGSRLVTFEGSVGGVTPLNAININIPVSMNPLGLANFSVNTNGFAQQYIFGPMTLGGDVTFNDTTNASSFPTINIGQNILGPYNVVINATVGGVHLSGVGTIGVPAASLTVTGPGEGNPGTPGIDAQGAYITSGDQLFNDAVVINGSGQFASVSGNITFVGALAANNIIWINQSPLIATPGPGAVTFGGPVTATLLLGSNIIVSGTTININGGAVTTSAAQSYNVGFNSGVINLGANTILTSNNSNITFGSRVEGPGGLIANVNSGTMFANDDMGFNTPLGYLTVNGTAQGINIISIGDINLGPFNVVTNDLVQSLAGNVSFLGGPVTLVSGDLTVLAANQIFFGLGASGVTGSGFNLSASTFNPANGPTGTGISGSVSVGQFSMGGTGGGNISPVSQDSFVNLQGGQQAWLNTILLSGNSGFFCVNGFCNTVVIISSPPVNVPPTEIFNVPPVVSCDASGCSNLELIMDNFIEAGIVTCAGNGCPYGFVEARDTNGTSRILMQGGVVYAGDTIYKDKGTCVCVKSVSGKSVCYGPSVTKAVIER